MKIFIILRKTIYFVLWSVDKILGRKTESVIICYHSLSGSQWVHSVELEDFKRQIEFLEQRYKFISLNDLWLFLKNKKGLTKPSVALVFDDGYESLLMAKDFLKQKNINPTVFIMAEPQKANRVELGTEEKLLTPKVIDTLIKAGWEIGCHSATHPDFYKIDKAKVKYEIGDSKKIIEAKFHTRVNFFAYPRGRHSHAVAEEVKKSGYKLALTMDDGPIKLKTSCFKLPKVAINKTHSYWEFKAAISPSVIQFRELVKKSFLNKFL